MEAIRERIAELQEEIKNVRSLERFDLLEREILTLNNQLTQS
jgi:predicted  nucleic acid-binding Zn-ribbon protein